MKIKSELIALSDYAIVSQDNKVSVIGIFDQIHVQKFPGGVVGVFLVAILNMGPNEKCQLEVKMFDKDQKNLLAPASAEGVSGANGKYNLVVQLSNLVFPSPGEYEFIIFNKDDADTNQRVASTKLIVSGNTNYETRTKKAN